jgi:hypothetical protein
MCVDGIAVGDDCRNSGTRPGKSWRPDTNDTGEGPRPPAPSNLASLPPIKLEDQWTTALVKRDARTFDQLLASNFVYTEDATVMGRSQVIRSVTGPDRVDWARNESMMVHEFGDVHVITGVLHLKGKGKQGHSIGESIHRYLAAPERPLADHRGAGLSHTQVVSDRERINEASPIWCGDGVRRRDGRM